jgi:hypothetical protein
VEFSPQNFVALDDLIQRSLQQYSVGYASYAESASNVQNWVARMQLVQHPEAFLRD